MSDRFELLMELIDEQAPALFDVDGVVYEAHVQSCLSGEVTAVARPYGTRDVRTEHRWALRNIRDVGRLVEPGAEPEDPLIEQARDLAARADEYSGLSLAERLLVERNQGEFHGRGD